MKLVVIGLDGAGFELIDPWIEQGILPNFLKIKRTGSWADMESVLPPVTSPNWKCYSTGKNPGKLGIYWWENIDWVNKRIYYPGRRKQQNNELWDIMSNSGMKVAVIGMPLTFPPKPINGLMISGGPDCGETGFTYPPKLEQALREKGWRNHPPTRFEVEPEKWQQEVAQIINNSFEKAKEYINDNVFDFLQVTVFYINSMHHFMWNSHATMNAWKMIDTHLGDIIDRGFDVLLMSDHGSNKIDVTFNINTWLKNEGYLKQKFGISSVFYHLGINRQRLVSIASRLHIFRLMKKYVPKKIYLNIPTYSGSVKKEAKTARIHWGESHALASGQGPIYINPNHKNKQSIALEIINKLESLVDPATGIKIVNKVYYRDEIYSGPYLGEAPDLIIDQAKGVHIADDIGHKEIFQSPERWKAENKKFGLFMAYGPNIKRQGAIDKISILDLAPTILHLMGLPIPDDMDGRVLNNVFKEESEAAHREVVDYQKSELTEIGRKIRLLKSQGKL